MKRLSGVFLHPTSLPSRFGIGDVGGCALQWIDLLQCHRQSLWQVCPVGPTGYGDSPYQAHSSFAGNPVLISPSRLVEEGLLTHEEADAFPALPTNRVDYGAAMAGKSALFEKAFFRFSDTDDFLEFCERERHWLDDYALYCVIKERHGGAEWSSWPTPLRLRFPAILDQTRATERKAVRYHKFLQYLFAAQWNRLKRYANEHGVLIMGDVPYYVAYDSADAWAMPDLFEFDEASKQQRVAGVPPDYFSATGQRWGNPIYRWDLISENGYQWWVDRVRKAFELFDYVRLDHFRGFESFWAIPASSDTAINGTWEKGPGIEFFQTMRREVGRVRLIAEDLGDITEAVRDLKDNVGIPGIKVLQFAFDGKPDNPYLPYNIEPQSAVYTGTHDNNTSLGWFRSLDNTQRAWVCEYLGCAEEDFLQRFLRLAYSSPADFCIIPFQDILGLGAEHRLNTPGRQDGNWQWRFTLEMQAEDKLRLMEEYTRIYGRAP